MSTELFIALFGGTGLVGLIGVIYQIVRERRSNTRSDLSGDLSLGEMFRVAARKEVSAAYEEIGKLRSEAVRLQKSFDMQAREIRDLDLKYRAAQDYIAHLIRNWQNGDAPEPPSGYFPDSQPIRRQGKPE